ncbi:MAG: GlcG/HbpS family heme-binding protein, partial [Geminicoccaceae bacterium]
MSASAFHRAFVLSAVGLGVVTLAAKEVRADCRDLPSHADLQATLDDVVEGGNNAGLDNEMWGTIVDRDGIVCAVAFTGDDRGDQWPGSRVISAQKANTANAFSLPGDAGFGGALSSGNLYGTVLEQGSLYGLQFSNPVDTGVAYKGPT